MVSMSDVELDGALRGGGEPEDDDLALGDGRGPLHLLQQPPSHTLTSVWDVCGDPKYLKNFTLNKDNSDFRGACVILLTLTL